MKQQQNSITIPKSSLIGITPAIAIIAVLLSKGKTAELLLFTIGIITGILIIKGYKKT